jgi:hypothetical protein
LGTLFGLLSFSHTLFPFHCWVVQVYPNPHAMFHSQLVFLFMRSSTIIPPSPLALLLLLLFIYIFSLLFAFSRRLIKWKKLYWKINLKNKRKARDGNRIHKKCKGKI